MILTLVGISYGTLNETARRARGVGADIVVRPPATSVISLSSSPMSQDCCRDRFAGRDTAQSPRELCGLRSSQPMDRSVSRDSATAKRSWTAAHGRQTFKNIGFQMIANIH
jgi:hypothetical protein